MTCTSPVSLPPEPQQPLTSGCFLRGLRSLTSLAFLAGFFSSWSLSPSPLEELAEALLSNLRRGTELQQQLKTPTSNKAGGGGDAAVLSSSTTCPEPSQPPAPRLPEPEMLCLCLTALGGFAFHEHSSSFADFL